MPTSSAAPAILPIAAVSQLAFRDAMSGLAAAVNVITTDGPADAPALPRPPCAA